MYETLIEEHEDWQRLTKLRFFSQLLHFFEKIEPEAPALIARCEVKIKALEKRLGVNSFFWRVPDDDVNQQD